MSSTAKLYAFSALVFAIGAIASVAGGHWGSFAVFAVLVAMMLWIMRRVDRRGGDEEKPPTGRQKRP